MRPHFARPQAIYDASSLFLIERQKSRRGAGGDGAGASPLNGRIQKVAAGDCGRRPQRRPSQSEPIRGLVFGTLVAFLAIFGSTAFPQNTINTVAGGGSQGSTALAADIPFPTGLAVDTAGNLYVGAAGFAADVYKAAPNGSLTVVAGSGVCGFSGDNGPATSAQLSGVCGFIPPLSLPATRGDSFTAFDGVAVDSAGNIFIADGGNQRIREVSATTGNITTVAGNGTPGFSGDGGLATTAELNFPVGVGVDSLGNLYIADTRNEVIRVVNTQGSPISVAGGTIQPGYIATVAGDGTAGFSGDGGPATSAELDDPEGVAVDTLGNLFVADSNNNRVREVIAAGDGAGTITTVAGNGTGGFSGDEGPATSAELNSPSYIALDSSNNLYIADQGNARIREVNSTGVINTLAGNGTFGFSGDNGPATSAQIDTPEGVAADDFGNLYFADAGSNRIRMVALSTVIIKTAAGGGTVGDTGPATSALLAPFGVAVDAAGDIFIADTANERVREVSGSTSTINTVAGTGVGGFYGDYGPATSAELSDPTGVALDLSDNAYITDTDNERVREVNATTGTITTVAGNGTGGFSGDNGPAISAELSSPFGVAVDAFGNIFIADSGNQRIREVSGTTGNITTVVGNGTPGFSGDGGLATTAELNFPVGVGVDSLGNLYIADTSNEVVRVVNTQGSPISVAGVTIQPGDVATVAGDGTAGFSGDGGPATSAELFFPIALAVDSFGDLFIADYGNNRIRIVTAATGIITTLGGNGIQKFSGDGGPGANAELDSPTGVSGGEMGGTLYVCDAGSSRIRTIVLSPEVTLAPQTLSFSSQMVGTTSAPQNVTLTNSGTAGLTLSSGSITVTGDFAITSSSLSACTSTFAPGTGCTLSITFTPTTTGPLTGTLTVTGNAFNAPQTVSILVQVPVATLSRTSVNFAPQNVNTTSPPQTVTVTNTGGAPLIVSAIAISGTNAADFAQTNSCGTLPATLAAGSACTVSVTFKPKLIKSRSASLTVVDNAAGSPSLVSLTGQGTDFALSKPPPAKAMAGMPVQYGMTAASKFDFTGGVAISCENPPPSSTCTVRPANVFITPSQARDVVVVVTTASGTGSQRRQLPLWPPNGPASRYWVFCLLALLAARLGGRCRRIRAPVSEGANPGLIFNFILLFVLVLLSCGYGSGPPGVSLQGGSATPNGPYNLTVTGSAQSGLKHMLNLQLTVGP